MRQKQKFAKISGLSLDCDLSAQLNGHRAQEHAPIAQRIERIPAKDEIEVRFPMGALIEQKAFR